MFLGDIIDKSFSFLDFPILTHLPSRCLLLFESSNRKRQYKSWTILTIMRPNVHTLSCWNVGVGDASVAGDQSSVDVGDGTDASAWNPLPHCHCHTSTLPLPLPLSSGIPGIRLPCHCMQPMPVILSTLVQALHQVIVCQNKSTGCQGTVCKNQN